MKRLEASRRYHPSRGLEEFGVAIQAGEGAAVEFGLAVGAAVGAEQPGDKRGGEKKGGNDEDEEAEAFFNAALAAVGVEDEGETDDGEEHSEDDEEPMKFAGADALGFCWW